MINSFRPKYGETYYTITYNESETKAFPVEMTYFGNSNDRILAENGYCFRTEEDARKAIDTHNVF